MAFRAVLAFSFAALVALSSSSVLAQAASALGSPTSVYGTIEGSNGTPVTAATVELRNWGGALLTSGITDEQGRYRFLVHSSGPYQLQVSHDGAVEQTTLGPAQTAGYVLRLHTRARPEAAPARAATVSLNDLEAPKQARSIYAQASKAIDSGNLDRAWILTNKTIAAAPQWGRPYMLRGVLEEEKKQYALAEHDLSYAVKQDPGNPVALTQLGKLYAATGQPRLASLYLHQALNHPPVLWPVYIELSSLDLATGDYPEAKAMAVNAEFASPPAPPIAHFIAAEAELQLKQRRRAALEFRSYIALAAHDPHSRRGVARARQILGALAIPVQEAAVNNSK